MARVKIFTTIEAPIELVFDTIAHIENFAKALPQLIGYEFLTDQKTGLGTRFIETRESVGKETRTEFEVTEYVPNERVRLTTDTNGTVWDTLFTVTTRTDRLKGEVTDLRVVMNAKAYEWGPRLLNPIMRKMFKSAIGNDMDNVRGYCQRIHAGLPGVEPELEEL